MARPGPGALGSYKTVYSFGPFIMRQVRRVVPRDAWPAPSRV
jgi:hypothetical protein